MSKQIKKRLKRLEKLLSKNCLTLYNSANENESITLSFVDNVVQMKKITKSEQTTTEEVSEVTFN